MSRPLFDIGADLLVLDNLLDEAGGDVSAEAVENAVTQWFEELQQEEADKLERYCQYIAKIESEVAVARSWAEEYAKRAQVGENRVKHLKARMKLHLEASGRTKATTSTGRTLAVQKNGGKPPLDCDTYTQEDLAGVDPRFVKVVLIPNTEAIRAALDEGESLSFARLLPAGTHLRIR